LTSDTQATDIEIKNILVPIDGSEYSLHAAQYATRIARNEKAQLFCIHVVTPRMPYGYATSAASSAKGRNYDDIKNKVESWFDIVRAQSILTSSFLNLSRPACCSITLNLINRLGLSFTAFAIFLR
jgi:hypothetical protein